MITSIGMSLAIHLFICHLKFVCTFFPGVRLFHLGEGVAQDRVRPAVPPADLQGAEAGVRAVCEGACRGRATGEEEQTPGKEGPVQAADGGG